ncbi:outer membrane autotransporter protein [Pseudomonas lurida]|nr:outer membrane autotransporter protein [Pseudomonas lurida]
MSLFAVSGWAATDVVSTSVAQTGKYVLSDGLTITPTGIFTITSPKAAMLQGSGPLTIDGGVLTGVGNANGFITGGEFKVINGGKANFATLGLGLKNAESQSTLISGAGSNVRASRLHVGGDGDTSVVVSNGGRLAVGTTNIGGKVGLSNAGKSAISIGAAEGDKAQAAGTFLTNSLMFTSVNSALVFNHTSNNYIFSAPISSDPNGITNGVGGRWGTIKVLAGTTTLTGDNSQFGGAVLVKGGVLRAGRASAFGSSSVDVQKNGTLDLAGFDQKLASLDNAGIVSLVGAKPGTALTINGKYVGNNGLLRVGLNTKGTSDRLILDGPTASASGKTIVQVANPDALGAATSGDGLEVVTAKNGATTTAQTTKDAFSLDGGTIDAGAYEYGLFAGDAKGGGENWYVRSQGYRAEVALYSALPNQLRQSNLAMLGDYRKRIGDEASNASGDGDRRLWTRVISSEVDISQGGGASARSNSHINGFQLGSDLLAYSNWRAGVYIGQLEGSSSVKGAVGGINNLKAGKNTLRSQYFGAYGTYTTDSGLYVDTVIQSGNHNYTVESLRNHAKGKGSSLLGSVEVGKSFQLGAGSWSVEPQLQIIHQRLDMQDSKITRAQVKLKTDNDWIARAGLRLKGQFETSLGAVQPYAQVNAYATSNGADVARFINSSSTTDVSTSTGGKSVELATGVSLELTPTIGVYSEIGKLWTAGGNTDVSNSVSGTLGLRMKW